MSKFKEIPIEVFVKVPIKVREYNNGCCHEECYYKETNSRVCNLFNTFLVKAGLTEDAACLRCEECCENELTSWKIATPE